MDAAEVTDVCRLCPSSGRGQDLLNVFDKAISFKYNIKEVIVMNTGIEIFENDLVSKKICQRCCNILYKMYDFRLDAMKQDRKLKERCGQILGGEGIRLPNTSIRIKKEPTSSGVINQKVKIEPEKVLPSQHTDLKTRFHPSVVNVFKKYPHFKLPKKCVDNHIAPVVALAMNEVETYFKRRKLNMKQFIYKPTAKFRASANSEKKKIKEHTPKEKTVAPLKISRKLLENPGEPATSTDNGYICTSVPMEINGRKRKISSDSNRSVELKLFGNDQVKSLIVPNLNVETPKTAMNIVKALLPVSNSSTDIPGTSKGVGTPSPAPSSPLCGNSRTPSPAPFSEDSRDSCSTNVSVATSSNVPEQPQFMETFGLTPTVTTTKSHTLLVCTICGSNHHNAFELKRHISKHMFCQFCKLKFKSVESKLKHIENTCQIKKVMNSSGPIVKLEKVHLNLGVRKKYRNAFRGFELIPDLEEPTPVEQVILKAASPPSYIADDAVIVLSDDENDTLDKSLDPLSGINTPLASMPPPAVENIVYSTVSIVRPDIRIKNNTILNSLSVENMTDRQLMKDLLGLSKPNQPKTAEAMIQTDFPASRDIKIHNSEGTCEFKNLKGQLATYKIPINVSNGPFHVAYQFRNKPGTNKSLELWNDLPVTDVCKKTVSQLPGENSRPLEVAVNSQVQSSDVTISSQPNNIISSGKTLSINTTLPIVSTALTSSSVLVTVPPAHIHHPLEMRNEAVPVLQTSNIPIITSNSATPLLQNYALSIISVPVINNPISIPRTYINSALNKSNRTLPSAASNNFSSRSVPLLTTSNNIMLSTNTLSLSRPDNISSIKNLGPASAPVVLSSSVPSLTISNNMTLTTNALPLSNPGNISSIGNLGPSIAPVVFSTSVPSFTTSNNMTLTTNTLPLSKPDNISPINSLGPPSVPISLKRQSSVNAILASNHLSTTTPVTQPPTTSSQGSSSSTFFLPEASKFRVKSVWELQ